MRNTFKIRRRDDFYYSSKIRLTYHCIKQSTHVIDKLYLYLSLPLTPPYHVTVGLLQLACVLLLLGGVQIGKYTVNFITVVKVLLVLFLIIGGLIFYNPANLSDGFAPFGVSGIMTGATSCFFGYVGYDEVQQNTVECNILQQKLYPISFHLI